MRMPNRAYCEHCAITVPLTLKGALKQHQCTVQKFSDAGTQYPVQRLCAGSGKKFNPLERTKHSGCTSCYVGSNGRFTHVNGCKGIQCNILGDGI